MVIAVAPGVVFAQDTPPPAPPAGAPGQPQAAVPSFDRLKDRGEGVSSSMFGTYVRRKEFIVYPFYEYYWDHNYEYQPSELGYVGLLDYRGRYRANEGLLFFAYGLTDDVIVEFEMAVIKASLEKSPLDPSGLPAKLTESGIGDVEGQVRWRWRRETDMRPEVFSYLEVVSPRAKDKPLIGTPGWELKFGTGIIRGYSWGTLTVRGAVQYEEASRSHFDLGEYAVEFLRQVSPSVRLYFGVEGTQDEIGVIPEFQWHANRNVVFKFNSGVGITSKATDFAPEIGVLFRFGPR
jgi:hypothetical protein